MEDPDGPIQVQALADILGRKPAGKPRVPDPIVIAWTDGTRAIPCTDCKGSGLESDDDPEKRVCPLCEGRKVVEVPLDFEMRVQCHYPEDPYRFQVAYLEVERTAQTPEVNDKGEETYPNEDLGLLHLTQGLVDKPMWLKNRSALKQFRSGVPSPVVAALQRKLMLVGGLDADFFSDSQAFMAPALLSRLASASRSDSATPPSKQPPSPNGSSPPSTTTTGPDATRSASNASPTTSGSSESIPTTAPKEPLLQPTPPTATS